MRRPKHPLPFEMQSIKFDLSSGKFIIRENGVTYYLNIEHTRLLKAYFRGDDERNLSIQNWFNDLDRFTKKEIKVIGKMESVKSDFYPDLIFEE